jgi:hypothetical protein
MLPIDLFLGETLSHSRLSYAGKVLNQSHFAAICSGLFDLHRVKLFLQGKPRFHGQTSADEYVCKMHDMDVPFGI